MWSWSAAYKLRLEALDVSQEIMQPATVHARVREGDIFGDARAQHLLSLSSRFLGEGAELGLKPGASILLGHSHRSSAGQTLGRLLTRSA